MSQQLVGTLEWEFRIGGQAPPNLTPEQVATVVLASISLAVRLASMASTGTIAVYRKNPDGTRSPVYKQ